MGKLDGRTIAFLQTDGVEQVELDQPREAVEAEGATAVLVSLQETFRGFDHLDKGKSYKADRTVAGATHEDFDALVLPGGVANPDFLRQDADAVAFVQAFFAAGKPVAAICHAPWTLIEAGVVAGRRLTSFPSLQTDLRNAGAQWVDEEVIVDDGLVTSRDPDDLPAFCARLVAAFAAGAHVAHHSA